MAIPIDFLGIVSYSSAIDSINYFATNAIISINK